MHIEPIYRCAVGIDVHLSLLVVCVIVAPDGAEPQVHLREFGAFKRDRRAMAQWIASFAPEVVVMESTGIYWKSPYAALEQHGIRALLVNPQHVKKVPGRKTDITDAQWLAMLARSGLLRPSFIPPAQLRELRLLARYHQRVTHMLTQEKNRLLKTLSDGGVRLSAVVSDPHGVAARQMIDALLEGASAEAALRFAGRLKAPRAQLLAALEGELSAQHLFLGRLQRSHIDHLQILLAQIEQQLIAQMEPFAPAIELLKTIPGVDTLSAAKLLVEIGVDMNAFACPARLAKWAGVCPGNDQSAGKRRSGNTPKANRYVRTILCEMAWSAVRTVSQFKSKFQGLVVRRGAKRAIIAIAHKLLKTVFVLLQRNVVYKDSTVDYEALAVKRNAPRWIKQLRKHGLLPTSA
jgi:transposase